MKRIPKKVQLGLYYVRVVQVPPLQMTDIAGDAEAAWAESLDPESDCAGTIYIRSTEEPSHKWNLLYHELVHAVLDLGYYCARYGPPKEKKDG
jgi:hypothetical protein